MHVEPLLNQIATLDLTIARTINFFLARNASILLLGLPTFSRLICVQGVVCGLLPNFPCIAFFVPCVLAFLTPLFFSS
jgi:hypothetical protein